MNKLLRIGNIFLTGIFLMLSLVVFSQPDGEQIFKANCTACHSLGKTKLIGPGLEGITDKRKKNGLKNGLTIHQI